MTSILSLLSMKVWYLWKRHWWSWWWSHDITCNIEEKYLNLWSLMPSHLLHEGPYWSILKVFIFLRYVFGCPGSLCINVFDKTVNKTFVLWESSAVLSPEMWDVKLKLQIWNGIDDYEIWVVLSSLQKWRQIQGVIIGWYDDICMVILLCWWHQKITTIWW